MKTIKNIALKFVAIILLAAVLLPSAIKLEHVFEDHKHEVCIDNSTTHVHEIDLDCEFYKFKINPNTYLSYFSFDISKTDFFYKSKIYNHNFLSNHQQRLTYLRGPPIS